MGITAITIISRDAYIASITSATITLDAINRVYKVDTINEAIKSTSKVLKVSTFAKETFDKLLENMENMNLDIGEGNAFNTIMKINDNKGNIITDIKIIETLKTYGRSVAESAIDSSLITINTAKATIAAIKVDNSYNDFLNVIKNESDPSLDHHEYSYRSLNNIRHAANNLRKITISSNIEKLIAVVESTKTAVGDVYPLSNRFNLESLKTIYEDDKINEINGLFIELKNKGDIYNKINEEVVDFEKDVNKNGIQFLKNFINKLKNIYLVDSYFRYTSEIAMNITKEANTKFIKSIQENYVTKKIKIPGEKYGINEEAI